MDDFLVSNPAQIAYLLARLRAGHSLLNVRPAGSGETYSSMLLDIDAGRHGWITLDQLYPPAGHRLVQPGTLLRISGRVDGVDAYWHGRVDRIEQAERGAVYRTTWPSVMEYRERRAVFRIAVPPGVHIPPSVFRTNDDIFKAQLLDLSTLGLGALAIDPCSLSVGDQLRCTLVLPDEKHLSVNLQVRSVRSTHSRLRFGALFLDPTTEQQQVIGRTVAALQRHWIQQVGHRRVA
ncbi:MAG: flagellar brake protein [Gammaproteobacteria bacterium]|nr:flagellar brake protein [Gammaproteobacteria bacterium]